MHQFMQSGRSRLLVGLTLLALVAAPLTANAIPVKSTLFPDGQPVEAPINPGGVGILPEAVPQEACQPDPLEPALQLLRCRYGPIEVTPGSNLILIGPVTIEAPRADGFMLKMTPNMLDAVTGEVPHIHEVHLHHGVWLDASKGLDAIGTPFMAAGEEKTVSSPPFSFDAEAQKYSGYGYDIKSTDAWALNYMIHNQTSEAYTTFITYDIQWLNANSPMASEMLPVKPLWWDTVGGFYPVYDPTTAPGAPDHVRADSYSIGEPMDIVWMAGHVHPGGKRIELSIGECNGLANNGKPLFTSEAIPNERAGSGESFGSWDYLMGATKPEFRFMMQPGDRVNMKTVYGSANPWYEAMGIVFGWGVALNDVPAAYRSAALARRCAAPSAELTQGIRTNVLPRDPIFGGTTTLFPDPATQTASGAPVSEIDIANFDYLPGGTAKAPAPVKAGSEVLVKNIDAAASIYHSITSCADNMCNKDSGQRYPLPSWDFDSAQLGYGVYGATAAKGGVFIPFYTSHPDNGLDDPLNWSSDPLRHAVTRTDAHEWKWKIPASAEVGETFAYFCRVHPFMRGSIQVVEAAV